MGEFVILLFLVSLFVPDVRLVLSLSNPPIKPNLPKMEKKQLLIVEWFWKTVILALRSMKPPLGEVKILTPNTTNSKVKRQ
jgi:hypothetical protein